VARTLEWHQPEPSAQLATALGVVALALIVWGFWDLLIACFSQVSDFSAEELPVLRRDRRFAPALYRVALEVLILALASAIIHLKRIGRRRPVGARVEAPLWALLVVAVLFAELPYRLLWSNQAERVDVAGERCYVLGTSSRETLVHCPDMAPPRNRALLLGDPQLRRTGITESLFSPPDHVR
jgi:hypothetical protein